MKPERLVPVLILSLLAGCGGIANAIKSAANDNTSNNSPTSSATDPALNNILNNTNGGATAYGSVSQAATYSSGKITSISSGPVALSNTSSNVVLSDSGAGLTARFPKNGSGQSYTAANAPAGSVGYMNGNTSAGYSADLTAMDPSSAAGNYAYQTFGVWSAKTSSGAIDAGGFSVGQVPTSMPSGLTTASYKGQSIGFFAGGTTVSTTTSAITVNANFGAGSASIQSSGTQDIISGASIPGLDFTATTKVAGTRLAGSVTTSDKTLSGAIRGQFYGPNATEVGGTFQTQNTTSDTAYIGAFGAKQ